MCYLQPPPTPTQFMTAEDPNHPYTCSESDGSEEVISETDSDEEYDDEDEEEIIRMKWIADGSKTLDDVIQKLRDQIRLMEQLKEEGWELVREMDDDWGFIKKKEQ